MRAYVCLLALPLLAQEPAEQVARQFPPGLVEPLPIRLLPPDSAVILGINVAGIRASKLGQTAFKQIQAQSPEMAKLIERGFNPLADIDELLVGGPAGKQNQGLVLMRGPCTAERLAAFAQGGSPAAGGKILSFETGGKPMSATCLDAATLAMGNPGMVKSALARRSSPRGPDLALSERAAAMRGAHDIWLVARADFSKVDVPNPQAAAMMKSEMMKSIQQIAAGVKLSPGLALSLDVTTKTGNDAEMLAGALMMMVGMAKSDPKRGRQMAPVLDNLSVRAEGNLMQASLQLTEQQMAELGRGMTAAAKPAPPSGEIVIHSSPRDMGTVTLPPPK